MSKSFVYIFVAALVLASSGFAEKERVIRIQNNFRFGYDDNVYLNDAEVESAEITEYLNISGKLNFSSRSDLVFYYQPEIRYRFDADPKEVMYHDGYAKLSHALSQRAFLTVTDRLRYQMREAQAGSVERTDSNYLENDVMGSLNYTLSSVSDLMLGGGYEFRTWDDDNYGETLGNNYAAYKASLSAFRELKPQTTKGMVGVDYNQFDYEGSRGKVDAVTLMTGADHTFNPTTTGFGRVGASFNSVDAATSEDNATPYLDAGLDYNPTERTSFNVNAGYSLYRSANSLYNAQNRFKMGLGLRHDLTGKISVSSFLSYINSAYDTDYALGGTGDISDNWFQWSVRGSYQINRSNFVELGYQLDNRTVDNGVISEWQRNRVDIGWRLRL